MGENQAAETAVIFRHVNVVIESAVIALLRAYQGYPQNYQFYLQWGGFMLSVRKSKTVL